MDTVTADLQMPHPRSLLYADDVFLPNGAREDLQRKTQKLKTHLNNYGLKLNIKDGIYGMRATNRGGVKIAEEEEELKKVTELKYLGSIMSSDVDLQSKQG